MPYRRIARRWIAAVGALVIGFIGFWFWANVRELITGQRVWPWSAYAFCGDSQPEQLPARVRIGVYEEFPVPWRLEKLAQVDFPITLAIAAPSRMEFLALRDSIRQTYPQVRDVYFWPTLSKDEGYYLGGWSSADGIERVAREADGLPVLWDLEFPRGLQSWQQLSLQNWWRNRSFLDEWLRERTEPTPIWRTHRSMGLNPLFLRLTAMHFDPHDYPAVSLHLDFYSVGKGLPTEELSRMLRCGVEQYGDRFVPAFGSLNDGEGAAELFVPVETLRRDLQVTREAGVSEIWLFQVNGLNAEYLSVVRETLQPESK